MKKIVIIIFAIIALLYYIFGIPNTVEGQFIASTISNIPILGSILTAIDGFSLLHILSSNLTITKNVFKLLSVVASLFITLLTMEKMSFVENWIDLLSDDDAEFKKYATFIVGFFVYLFYAIILNVIFLDKIILPIFNYTIKAGNKISHITNELNNLK